MSFKQLLCYVKNNSDVRIAQKEILTISYTITIIKRKEQDFSQIDKMQGVIINLRSGIGIKESRHKLISMLEDLLSNLEAGQKKELLEIKHNIKMTTTLEGRISNMCNLSEYILNEIMENFELSKEEALKYLQYAEVVEEREGVFYV